MMQFRSKNEHSFNKEQSYILDCSQFAMSVATASHVSVSCLSP